jgi:dolichyl-phosphate beta-glucosyltransferase
MYQTTIWPNETMSNIKYALSVIIPTYRESNRIERCIVESLRFLRSSNKIKEFEIIFASDKSNDDTIPIIKKFMKENQEIKVIEFKERQQKGGAIKSAVKIAQHNLILFYDVDLSTPLYEIDKFLNIISNYDLLIASRGMKESRVQKKFIKIAFSKAFSILKYLILGINFKDTQCGFKMFNKKAIALFEKQTIKSSAFDVELLFIAKKWKLMVKEVPVTWIDSDTSNFNTFKVIIIFLKEIIRVKLNDIKGSYNP